MMPPGPELLGPPQTHRVQRALGAGIEIGMRATVSRHDGAGVGDVAAGAGEVWQCGLHEEEGAARVGLENPVEAVDGVGGKASRRRRRRRRC